MSAAGRTRTERGFALLIVLWTMGLLALLGTHLAATGRGETELASNLRNAASAQAAADGAVFGAVFHLLDAGRGGWAANGDARELRLPGGVAEVRVESEAGKVNPNTASVELMAALLRRLGADANTAADVAAAIADWRFPSADPRPHGAKAPQYRAAGRDYGPPNAPFETLDELGLVLGMTPDLLARLMPHLSLYNPGDPDPSQADPVVAQAIKDATGQAAGPVANERRPGTRVVSITATVLGAGGARFTRRAIVRVGQASDGGLYRILRWG